MHWDVAKLTLRFLTKICAMLLLNIRMFPRTTSGALIDTFAPLVSNSMLSHITEPAISSHQYLCLTPISLVATTSNPCFGDRYHSEYGQLVFNPLFLRISRSFAHVGATTVTLYHTTMPGSAIGWVNQECSPLFLCTAMRRARPGSHIPV